MRKGGKRRRKVGERGERKKGKVRRERKKGEIEDEGGE